MLRQWLSFRTLSIALAILLIVTAALKLHLLLTDPFADIKTGTSLPLLWLAVFAEAGVVWIVFSKTSDNVKWVSLVSLFGMMTAVSIFNVVTGKSSCGCAGVIEIPPLYFVAFDVGAIILLWVSIPQNRIESRGQDFSVNAGLFLGYFFVAVCVSFTLSPPIIGIVRNIAYGESVEVRPLNLGRQPFEMKATGVISLTNHTDLPTKVLGVRRSCQCMMSKDLLFDVIPGKGKLAVDIEVKPIIPGKFHQRILFFLDSGQQHVVVADVFAFFVEN